MRFVDKPNLPENSEIVLIGEKYSQILGKSLINHGLFPIFVPDNPCVDDRLSSHADLSLVHLGRNKLLLASYLKGSGFSKRLNELGMQVVYTDVIQVKKYPEDSGLNVCICGKNLIYNPKTADRLIVDNLTNGEAINKIAVKQGYSKCAVCVVDDNSIITADEGIHKRAVEEGLHSLKISPGYIELPGFDYGFIGGASFKLSKNKLAFTGHLKHHPDKERILEFLSLHNVEMVYITEKPAFDVGSVIQIVEK